MTTTIAAPTADELAELFDTSTDDDIAHIVSDAEHWLSWLERRAPYALCGTQLTNGDEPLDDDDGPDATCPECVAEARRRGWKEW